MPSNCPQSQECTEQQGFTYLRQASRSALTLPATAFVTAIDVGTANGNVHSPVKQVREYLPARTRLESS